MTQQFVKDPGDKTDYTIDYSAWLDSDTISASTWTPDTGITVVTSTNTTTAATVWLSGGTAGTDYTVTNQITTAGGRIKQTSLKIQVREQ